MIDHTLLKSHAYGLVAAEHLETLPTGIVHIPLASGIMDDSIALMPSLIELGQLNEAKSLELLELMNSQMSDDEAPVISTLISTDYDLKRIKSYFARVQICSNIKGERAWLRVHDPRVWAQLERVLKPSTFIKLVEPIRLWTMYYGKEWVRYTPPPGSTGHQVFATLLLNDQEWAALNRAGIVNRSLRLLDLNSHAQAIKYSAALDGLIVHAQSLYGVTRVNDLVCYLIKSWSTHPQFDKHPVVSELLQRFVKEQATGVALDDAMRAISADQWQQISKEVSKIQGFKNDNIQNM